MNDKELEALQRYVNTEKKLYQSLEESHDSFMADYYTKKKSLLNNISEGEKLLERRKAWPVS